MIYTVRTTTGREDIVIDMLETKIRHDSIEVKSVFHPAEIKGYVFIEGSPGNIHKALQGMMHVKGFIEKPVKMEEIKNFLEYKKARIAVDMGDVIEIVGGPFKGEKGKITRVDKVKGDVTIELLEAAIPIPVTISTEFVKIIKKAKPEASEVKPKPRMREEPEEEGRSIFEKTSEEIAKDEERRREQVDEDIQAIHEELKEEEKEIPEPEEDEPEPEEEAEIEEPEESGIPEAAKEEIEVDEKAEEVVEEGHKKREKKPEEE
ncbi:MAG: transcription elongation factor Spt5 [Candidatus Aenigmarchaeota archaeon]|nr:transcription elongation factor Spt5 [Candidatus Aenigmarchaeota archaeon]